MSAVRADGGVADGLEFARTPAGVRATCVAAEPVEAGVRVELRLEPAAAPRWLVPGVFYGENRPAECRRIFPRFVPGHVDLAAMESPAWSFRADRCSTPAVFADGAGLVTSERSPLGQSGVGFAYEDGRPLLRLHFPYREEPLRYDGFEAPQPPDVRVHRWTPGESVELPFTVHTEREEHLHAKGEEDLVTNSHKASFPARVLRVLHSHRPPAERAGGDPGWVSTEEAAELAAWGLHRWHFRDDPPRLLETAAFDRDAFRDGRADRDAMHVAWVSGTPYACALLRHGRRVGNGEYVAAAEAVLDHIAQNLTPGGTFWSQWTAARGWTTGWHPDKTRLHARTLGEATLFMLRAGPRWQEAVASNLDVACRTQRDDGALPAAHHVETGDAVAWEGTAGLAWVPALVEAGRLEEARGAGDYYRQFVEAEFLYGAAEDTDLAPTSEDGYLAVMAYVALGDWETAARAADWMLTFRYTYDVAFSERTLLGRYGFRTRGADQASSAHHHLHAFGLICLPEMVRLARETGDDYFLERTRENLACFRQFIAREDGDFDAQRGMTSERYYQTDCFQAKGMLLTLSHAWSVGVLLYACEAALELGL